MSAKSEPENPQESSDLPIVAHQRSEANTTPRKKRTGLIIFLLAAAAAFSLIREKKPLPEVAPAPISQQIYSLGRLEPEGEIIFLAAPSSAGDARISELEVEEGDDVKKGDLIATLDNQPRLNAALEVAKSNLAQTEATLARTELEVETTRNQLTAALRSAEANYEQAETNASRYRKLADAAAATREQEEDAALKLTTARENVTEARSRLARYSSLGEENVDLLVALSEIAAARASLIKAEADLADASISAPADGTILQIHTRPGERIGQSPFLEMGRTAKMMARVEVYESEVPRLALGDPVILTANPLDTELTGTIERIANYVQKQSVVEADPAANTDARVVEVWVRLAPESSEKAARFVNLQVRAAFGK